MNNMSVSTANNRPFNYQVVYQEPIEWDHSGWKVLSCLPLVGMIINGIALISLTNQYKAAKDQNDKGRQIKILQVHNHYSLATIGRNAITTAITISIVAALILSAVATPLVGGIIIGLSVTGLLLTLALRSFNIHENSLTMQQLS